MMKKLSALLLALCLIFACAAVSAEAAAAETPTVLEMDGFTLTLKSGEYYATYEKVAEEPYVFVFPFFSNNDLASNYVFMWMGGPFDDSVETITGQMQEIEATIREQIEAQGATVATFSVDYLDEAELNGEPCTVLDTTVGISSASVFPLYQRVIYLGEKGYSISITAVTADELEKITDQMAWSLSFN